jgi:2-amino-4-hydroxy-6-hydroxymethyldihydropteridine diphosphokinase
MPEAYVAVGSNVDRERWLREGLRQLRERFGPLRVSPVYETEPVGFSGEPFFNLVVAFATSLAPTLLQAALREIELRCGRAADARKFTPRTLDLDLLVYGDGEVEEDGLRLPRADLLRYGFLLGPLADLAPALRHPQSGRGYGELWRDFSGEGAVLRPVALDLLA